MSTGADCTIFEKEKFKWGYMIQDYPYGETDSYATHGPFRTFQEAMEHLDSNYANPGGFSVSHKTECDHKGYLFEKHGRKECRYCGDILES